MANKFFPSLKLVLNGNIITQCKNVTVDFDPALNPVNTQEGRSGYSEGARFMTFSGEMSIPKEGPQFNPTRSMDRRETVFVQAFAGPLSCETEGVFTSASFSWSESSDTGGSFTIEADWAPFE